MNMCDAEFDGKGLRLMVFGGVPAYVGALYLKIRGDAFDCAFDANYFAPGPPTRFRITKKQLHVRKLRCKVGERYFAWLSVEFEEGWEKDGKMVWRPFKVEGYVKPVITKPAQ